jgi:hypothetical protein
MTAGRAGVHHGGEGRVDGRMRPYNERDRIGRMALDRDVLLLMLEDQGGPMPSGLASSTARPMGVETAVPSAISRS